MTSSGCGYKFLRIVSCNATRGDEWRAGRDACINCPAGEGRAEEMKENDEEMVNQVLRGCLGSWCFDSCVPGDEKTVDVSGLPR